jgi:hypothetical protein
MMHVDENDPVVVDFDTMEAVACCWNGVMNDIRNEASSIAERHLTEISRTVEGRNAACRVGCC